MSDKVNLTALLGDTVVIKKDGIDISVPVSELEGKYIGLYFSAHWCPPCRAFTPVLRNTYHLLQAANKGFEVVFISGDHTQANFDEYFKDMPWCAIPFAQDRIRRSLNSHFRIMGIPSLIILGPDGQVLNSNARMAVIKDRSAENFPWEGQTEPRQFGPWMTIGLMLVLWIVYKVFFEH